MFVRRATRISHTGSTGTHKRMPVIGRPVIESPANDNNAPRRPLPFWIAATGAVLALASASAYLIG
jgi:hypothetical protein